MTAPMAGGRRRIDRVLAADYLDGLGEMPVAEVRARRREAQQEEVDLSYLRRLVQGRIDILRAELDRRAAGGGESVVARLSVILAGSGPPVSSSARHLTVEPSSVGGQRRQLEQLVADVGLSDITGQTVDELFRTLETLIGHERRVSRIRHDVQRVADACGAELARRYRDGQASVDDLLAASAEPADQ